MTNQLRDNLGLTEGFLQNIQDNGWQLELGAVDAQGRKQGEWNTYAYNGVVTNVISYHDGQRHGEEIVIHETGSHVVARIYWNNGQLRQGAAKTWDESGEYVWERNYKDGREDGVQKQYNKKGQQLLEYNYREGKRNGLQRKWNDQGQLVGEEYWQNGQLHGIETKWDEQGRLLQEVHWQNGKRHGVQAEWRDNGRIKQETTWQNGEKHGAQKIYHVNGHSIEEVNYQHNQKHGAEKYWNEHGQLTYCAEWKEGKEHGYTRQWTDEGQLFYEAAYQDGRRHGVEKEWDKKTGSLNYIALYEKGKRLNDGINKTLMWVDFFDSAKAFVGYKRRDPKTLAADQLREMERRYPELAMK